jgi:hypothetical protein
MRRRDFITLLSGVFLAWPLATPAQESDAAARVGPILHMRAEVVANKIDRFIEDVKGHVEPLTQMPWVDVTKHRFELLRLLRQIPALADIARIDSSGKAQVQVSRSPTPEFATRTDLSKDPKFTEALAKKIYYGPVHFRKKSQR